jgi:hypothetical protein
MTEARPEDSRWDRVPGAKVNEPGAFQPVPDERLSFSTRWGSGKDSNSLTVRIGGAEVRVAFGDVDGELSVDLSVPGKLDPSLRTVVFSTYGTPFSYKDIKGKEGS